MPERVSSVLAPLPRIPGRALTTPVRAPLEPVTKSMNPQHGGWTHEAHLRRPGRESLDREPKTLERQGVSGLSTTVSSS